MTFLKMNKLLEKKEKTMKIRAKFAILLLAMLITFIGFSMMASSTVVDMIKMGR